MRTFLIAAVAATAFGMSNATSADVAGSRCTGGHVACGSHSTKSASSSHGYKKSAKKTYRSSKKTAHRGGKKRRVTNSYSGS